MRLTGLGFGQANLGIFRLGEAANRTYLIAQLINNKEGELQFELRNNPWKLANIIDWNKADSEAQLIIPSATTAES